jgi:hypothetical protein|tara:strand:+ start:2012 stop:2218 length:207 start_codon:yes stop_codon:yes gene_type:complete
MKKHERIIRVRFSGHGHYKVTISYYGEEYTATITDMTLIDNYKDDNPVIKDMNWLYDVVKRKAVPSTV